MTRQPLPPAKPRKSQYGIDPALVKMRGCELPGITSVGIAELFPEAPPVIYPRSEGDGRDGLAAIREATVRALENVDLGMIKPGHTVNLLASHHGFTLLGGGPYAEMLRTLRDVIIERTGTRKVRLRAGVGLRFRESEEYIKLHGLDDYFEGQATNISPIDRGVAIDTVIGRLYGLAQAYNADWIVHTHNSDVREIHFHRQLDRAVKPFGMSYARIETRSCYHQNLGPRASNFVARAIFDSDFVQKKFAFAVFLQMSPYGILSVDAENNLYAIDERVNAIGLKYYSKLVNLFGEIDECICILDFPGPIPYVFAGGTIYANMIDANVDLFDLDVPLPPYTFYTESYYTRSGKKLLPDIPPVNPALKMVVHNYAFGGYPCVFFSKNTPTIVVGREQADLFNRDPQNMEYMKHAMIADTLETAMDFAYRTAKTDKVIIFDGASMGMNVSESLAAYLRRAAPRVIRRVEQELLPKWLAQRGMSRDILAAVA
ncbi:MAG: hypothetical protein HYY96_14795 [Candidatus Tectomicrobia bacterium]|nr:hypothetical protein [Candidatus Tectomicrobia bacterium]